MITSISNAQMLMKYNAWANKLIFEAVAELDSGEPTKERQTLFRNIIGTLSHNYVISLIWQANLEGHEHGFTEKNIKESLPLEELWALQQETDKWYIAYSDKLADQALNELVEFRSTSGTEGVMTRGEILLHTVNHTTYHRGFIADMFYQIPAKPPTTDLPVFLQNNRHEK